MDVSILFRVQTSVLNMQLMLCLNYQGKLSLGMNSSLNVSKSSGTVAKL